MKQLLPRITVITGLLSIFGSCLSKPQFFLFCTYINGLIALANKSMHGMCAALLERKHRSSLSRFLSSKSWDTAIIINKYYGKTRHFFTQEPTRLIIDDT